MAHASFHCMLLFGLFLLGWVIAAVDMRWFADDLNAAPRFRLAT